MINALRYKDSIRFLKEYNFITYPEFDYYSVHNLNLFSSFEDVNLDDIELEVSKIEKVLPSMKRIFAKPIIHLIDEEELVNVESVRKIDNKTINHAAMHSEYWDNITENGIKPIKLLTNNYRDNYAIYENVVFCRAVDYALNFTRHYSRLLKDMIYTNKKLEIDLLERENHMSYYLALGKLETGHLRSFATYIDVALSLISRMDFIIKILESRLNRPIYKKCHKVKGKLKLRKTNILRMQKDYRNIYKYMKDVYKDEDDDITDEKKENEYLYFCKYLLIFSIGHFNFQVDKRKHINFKKLNLNFKFKNYKINLSDKVVNEQNILKLTFKNDKEFTMYLLPSLNANKKLKCKVETHILTDKFDSNGILVSINNIDSFRRLQQLVLKGMIYSTKNFTTCPFCGNEMVKENDIYHCMSCRQVIKKEHCEEKNKSYYVSTIYKYQIKDDQEEKLLMNKQNESLLHYRNITEVTSDLSFICPHCHKIHKKENKNLD